MAAARQSAQHGASQQPAWLPQRSSSEGVRCPARGRHCTTRQHRHSTYNELLPCCHACASALLLHCTPLQLQGQLTCGVQTPGTLAARSPVRRRRPAAPLRRCWLRPLPGRPGAHGRRLHGCGPTCKPGRARGVEQQLAAPGPGGAGLSGCGCWGSWRRVISCIRGTPPFVTSAVRALLLGAPQRIHEPVNGIRQLGQSSPARAAARRRGNLQPSPAQPSPASTAERKSRRLHPATGCACAQASCFPGSHPRRPCRAPAGHL